MCRRKTSIQLDGTFCTFVSHYGNRRLPGGTENAAVTHIGVRAQTRRTAAHLRQIVIYFEWVGSPAWIRTTIHGSKGRCPTIRRPGNSGNASATKPVYNDYGRMMRLGCSR